MKFENEQHLGGKLVGIGKIRTDGTMEHHFLEKPIKNKIVSSGLDHMLRYNGNNVGGTTGKVPMFTTKINSHYGSLHYSSFGSSAESTSFFDEGLKAEVGTKIETKVTGTGLCGTKINAFGNYSFRVTHKHNAVSETTTVNEIAWFGRYGSSSYKYPMFSRVVLDTPIVLQAGEQLIATYQLDIQYACAQQENIAFFGLTDVNGQPLRAQKKLVMYQSVSDTEWRDSVGGNYIKYTGEEDGSYVPSHFGHPACVPATSNPTASNYYGGIFYSLGKLTLPSDGNYYTVQTWSSSYEKSSLVAITGGSTSANVYDNCDLLDYNGVGRTTKYRDARAVFGAYAPYMSSSTEYKDITNLLMRGYAYRFGYYDDGGNWVQQAFRKYANQELTLTFRTRFTTEDTTSEE